MKSLLDFQTNTPLVEEDTRVMVAMFLLEQSGQSTQDLIEALSDIPMAELINKRLAVFAPWLTLTPPMVLLTIQVTHGVPGRAVMMLHAYTVYASMRLKDEIKAEDFSDMFPMGLPDFDAAWAAQKLQGMNLVDDPANWPRKTW